MQEAFWGHAAWVLGAAFALDATLGEPHNALHPVVWMGRAIAPLKRFATWRPLSAFLVGLGYAALVPCGFAAAFACVLGWLDGHWVWRTLFEVYGLFSCFALKGLVAAADQVRVALAKADLPQARAGLASLCSRDASTLSAPAVSGAAIESLTENLSDSVVAPLFYFVLFGLPGAVFYRAVNTMDAMVGYRGKYEYVGKSAARLDDLLNLIPARLSAALLVLSGLCLRLDVRRGLRVWQQDRMRTESPNAGHPMAMGAGLLGVRLDKCDAYSLGQDLRLPEAGDVARAQTLIRVSGVWTLVVALLVLCAWGGLDGIRF